MRCPKCEFITFDHVTTCPKCNKSLTGVTADIQGTSLNVKPPSLLRSVTKQSSELSVDEMLSGHDLNIEDTANSAEMLIEDAQELELSDADDLDLTSLDIPDMEIGNEHPAMGHSESILEAAALPELDLEPSLEDDEYVDDSTINKFSAELSDIDISDLVNQDQAMELNSDIGEIPSLEPLSETDDTMPTLEPIYDDDSIPSLEPLSSNVDDDIPSLSAMDDVVSEEFDVNDMATLLENEDFSDLDQAALDDLDSSLNDFGSLDDGGVLAADEMSFNQPMISDVTDIEPENAVFDPSSLDDLMEAPNEPVNGSGESFETLPLAEAETDIISTLMDESTSNEHQEADMGLDEQGFDLSFDDNSQDSSPQESANPISEISLSMDENFEQNIIAKETQKIKPEIPDLGLTLESEE